MESAPLESSGFAAVFDLDCRTKYVNAPVMPAIKTTDKRTNAIHRPVCCDGSSGSSAAATTAGLGSGGVLGGLSAWSATSAVGITVTEGARLGTGAVIPRARLTHSLAAHGERLRHQLNDLTSRGREARFLTSFDHTSNTAINVRRQGSGVGTEGRIPTLIGRQQCNRLIQQIQQLSC